MADKAIGGSQDIMDADAEADFLDHLMDLFRKLLYE